MTAVSIYVPVPAATFLSEASPGSVEKKKRGEGGFRIGVSSNRAPAPGLCQQNHVIAIFFEKVWPPSVGCPIGRRRLCSVSDFKTINHQVNRSNSQFPFPFFPYQVARREIESQDAYRSWSQT